MTQKLWMGKLFIFRDDSGEHVSLAPPTIHGNAMVRAFAVRGPFIPIGLQKTITLPDTEKWLGEFALEGLHLRTVHIET